MIYISIFISIIYFIIIIAFIFGFNKIDSIQNKNTTPKNAFSIVIPFRNEAHNLPHLLNSLSAIKYPVELFQVLLINDKSNDNFKRIIEDFIMLNPNLNISLIHSIKSTNSPKKEAITFAIKQSKFEWIVTTDADCIIPSKWLQLFNQHIEEKQPFLISAPVKFKAQNSFLYHFQNLNFISLIGSTIGGFGLKKPFMCNGANLCYNKNAFIKVNGFEGNSMIASGDDVFLLEKINSLFPNRVCYLKSNEAIVLTNAENSLNSFFNQQIRWASKSTAYKSNFSKFIGLIVFSMNFVLITGVIAAILNPFLWKYLFIIFIQKIVLDFILILITATFLNNIRSLKYYIFISLLYPYFIVFTGFLSLFKSYEWKGRNFRK